MAADIEMLPLPAGTWARDLHGEAEVFDSEQMQDYARANVAHATAAKDAEIERLRALLLEACDDGDEADADLLATLERARAAEAKVERLAEALRDALECGNDGDWQSARQYITAALRDHDQEGKDG